MPTASDIEPGPAKTPPLPYIVAQDVHIKGRRPGSGTLETLRYSGGTATALDRFPLAASFTDAFMCDLYGIVGH